MRLLALEMAGRESGWSQPAMQLLMEPTLEYAGDDFAQAQRTGTEEILRSHEL